MSNREFEYQELESIKKYLLPKIDNIEINSSPGRLFVDRMGKNLERYASIILDKVIEKAINDNIAPYEITSIELKVDLNNQGTDIDIKINVD